MLFSDEEEDVFMNEGDGSVTVSTIEEQKSSSSSWG